MSSCVMRRQILTLALTLTLSSCVSTNLLTRDEGYQPNKAHKSAMMANKILLESTVESLISNPVSGTAKGCSMWWNRGAITATESLAMLPSFDQPAVEGDSIEEVLDKIGMPAPIPGRVNLLIDGKPFFRALERSIAEAERSIDMRIYIYDNDDVAVWVADQLKAKDASVRTRVLADRIGSVGSWWSDGKTSPPEEFVFPKDIVDYVNEGENIKMRLGRTPWLVADHGKLIVVDGEHAYLGGMNIGREYLYEWHDMMARVDGPIVTALQDLFNRSWTLQSLFGDFKMPFRSRLEVPEGVQAAEGEYGIRILRTGFRAREVRKSVIAAIRASKHRVYVHNPYISSGVMVRALMEACERGVDVRVIAPIENDSSLMHRSNKLVAKALLPYGGKIYAYPIFSHAKAIVVDDWACIGSANFDGLSMRINSELNIGYSDPKAVKELVDELFLPDMAKSYLVKKDDFKILSGPVQRLLLNQL